MAVMQWSVDFFTGLPEIDRQHEELFALVNRLHEARAHRSELLGQAFADLRDYVRDHFGAEEKFMAEASLDPAYVARHHAAHANFIMRIDDIWEQHRAGSESAADDLLAFLVAWLREHILVTDRKMAVAAHHHLGSDAPHNQFSHF